MDTERSTLFRAWTVLLVLAVLSFPASAAERDSLAVGNAAYADAPVLANPPNEVANSGPTLGHLGFDVTRIDNAGELGLVFRKMGDAVLASTVEGRSRSCTGRCSAGGVLYLAQASTSGTTQVTAEQLAVERVFWESVNESEDPEELQVYLDRYPDGTYSALARVRLKRLREAPATEEMSAGEPETVSSAPSAPAPSSPAPTAEEVESSLGLARATRRMVQQGLASLGYAPGPADGLFGTRTREAIRRYQSAKGLKVTGYLTAEQSQALAALEEEAQGDTEHREAQRQVEERPRRTGNAAPPPEPNRLAAQEAMTLLSEAMTLLPKLSVETFWRNRYRSTLFYLRAKLQASAGDISGALSAARGTTDAASRTGMLGYIAEAQAKAGDGPGAAQTISEALSVARGIADVEDRISTLGYIAEAQAKIGDGPGAAQTISEALSVARGIADVEDRVSTLGYIAEAQAKTGDGPGAAQTIYEALSVVQSIRDADDRVVWRSAIARRQGNIAKTRANAGDISGALNTARGIADEAYRAEVLRDVAEAQTEVGDDPGAAQTISEALSVARPALHRRLSVARSMTDVNDRIRSLRDIARAQAKAGDGQGAVQTISEALSVARSITDASDRSWVLLRIARMQAEVGDGQSAAQFISEVLRNIAEAKAEAGNRQGIFSALAMVFGDIAQAEARDNLSAAGPVISEALGNIAQVPAGDGWDIYVRDITFRGLVGIAQVQASAGDIPGALSTARSITDAAGRTEALGCIAEAQAKAGDGQGAAQAISEALSAARSITDADDRTEALRDIAEAQAKAGDGQGAAQAISEALNAARSITDADSRAFQFEYIVYLTTITVEALLDTPAVAILKASVTTAQ